MAGEESWGGVSVCISSCDEDCERREFQREAELLILFVRCDPNGQFVPEFGKRAGRSGDDQKLGAGNSSTPRDACAKQWLSYCSVESTKCARKNCVASGCSNGHFFR